MELPSTANLLAIASLTRITSLCDITILCDIVGLQAYYALCEMTMLCDRLTLSLTVANRRRARLRYPFAYFGRPTPIQSPGFSEAFMTIFGNYITTGDPSISASVASGEGSPSTGSSPASDWPAWTLGSRSQLNLNETGGMVVSVKSFGGLYEDIKIFVEPGLRNSFETVDTYGLEGGRRVRCDFKKSVGRGGGVRVRE